MTPKSFFIAGIMQGSKTDSSMADQSYRKEIAEIIHKHYPDARIFDPLLEQMNRFGTRQQSMLESAAQLDQLEFLYPEQVDANLQELSQSFHDICNEAAKCDVIVAFFPKEEVSMGTAVEMYSGWLQGKKVITISKLRQNLTLLACSNVIIPDIASLDVLFSQGFLWD